MKKFILLIAVAGLLAGCGSSGTQSDAAAGDTAAQSGDSANLALDNATQKRSYALGMDIGNSLNKIPVEIKLPYVLEGIRDKANGNKTKLSDKEEKKVMQAFVGDVAAAKQKQQKQQASKNEKAGEAFLAKNKKKDGVEVTDSGLQYKVVKKGDGSSPGASDTVTVDYTGKHIDGTVFDSTKKHGQPATFPVNAVIPGWTEGLQLMHQGAEYKFFIPAKLAYGKQGAGAAIEPNETLVFDVKLLKVKKNQKASSKDADTGSEKDVDKS